MELDDETVQLHLDMLNDRKRSSSFINAIRNTVKPGDVVVDIGTGTGILAMAAAQAGAKHVYAIEAGNICGITNEILKRNKLDKKVSLIHGLSSDVKIPERADILVTETIGHEALAENIVDIVTDARKRFLKPNAAIIPNGIKIYALPVSLPMEQLERFCFTGNMLEKWGSWYGMDFSLLEDVNRESLVKHLANPKNLQPCNPLSDPVLLIDLDFYGKEMNLSATKVADITATGDLNAIIIFFELQLSPGIVYSTHPAQLSPDNHWQTPIWISGLPIDLKKGDTIKIKYKYNLKNDHSFMEVLF